MDKKDAILLNYLRVDGRMPLTTMSKRTGVPISTFHDRLKRSEAVRRVVALLDFRRLGYSAKAYLLLKAHRNYRDDLASYLYAHFHVNNIYKINNGYDFLIEVVFRDMKSVEDFIEEVEYRYKVRETVIHYIIDDIKREGFFADPQRVDDLVRRPSA